MAKDYTPKFILLHSFIESGGKCYVKWHIERKENLKVDCFHGFDFFFFPFDLPLMSIPCLCTLKPTGSQCEPGLGALHSLICSSVTCLPFLHLIPNLILFLESWGKNMLINHPEGEMFVI